jgi:hypothetical protein
MVQETLAGTQQRCEVCGADISEVRLKVVPNVRTCITCQRKLEKKPGDGHLNRSGASRTTVTQRSDAEARDTLQVEGSQVVVGRWSGNLMDLVAQGDALRNKVRSGKKGEARALVRGLPVEAQAALVAMGEDPEELLSLTGVDDSGGPAYSTQVVAMLPSELLSGLISIDVEERKFNTELIRAMSPEAFRRTMGATLELVDNPRMRTRVSWEWLQALATLDDFSRRAELLRSVDPALLEEALLDRLAHLDLHTILSAGEFSIYRFRLFSSEGIAGVRPSAFIDDPEMGEVLDAVYEAVPDLLGDIVRVAWERAGGETG